jgi:hypothetical protein
MHRATSGVISAITLMGAVSFAFPGTGQNSDFNMSMHANSHVTAKDIGLPGYPGATPFKEKDDDSSSGDVLFLLNSFHFSVKEASFVTTDSQQHVLEFYRKPLAKFGEVLECNHGRPVGSLAATKSGLTCGDHKNGGVTVNESDDDHELRAGTPEQFWIVGVENAPDGKTKFGLVALVLPKDEGSK